MKILQEVEHIKMFLINAPAGQEVQKSRTILIVLV